MSAQVRDRLVRIDFLSKTHKQHPEWDEQRLINEICIMSGVRPRRAMEYVELLKKTGRW